MRIVGVILNHTNYPIVLDFSGVQTPGVLYDLFFYEGLLGAHLGPEGVAISLWAPTAQQVLSAIHPHLGKSAKCKQ